jgi:GPH family glycoside/pentoside/hexuronide:cation symporter
MEANVKKLKITKQTLKNWVFGSGEFGRYSVQALALTYAVYYFTTVYGISAAATGTIVLVARIIGAAWSFIYGILIDRVKSKNGKARPFILYLPIVITLLLMGMFSIPFADGIAKELWAGIMYTLLVLATNTLSVAYSVLVNLVGRTTEDRLSLGNSRAFFTIATYIIFNGGMLMFVELLGKDNPLNGFRYVGLIAGVLTILLNIVVYATTKEHSGEAVVEKKSIFKAFVDQVSVLWKDGYTAKFVVGYFFYYIYITLQYSACVYYFLFKVNRGDLIGPFFLATNFVVYAFLPFMRKLVKSLGTVKLGVLISIIAVVAELVRFATGDVTIWLFFILIFIVSISENLYYLLFPVMISDCADYAKYKHGTSASGSIVGTAMMGASISSAVGGALLSYLLEWAGYTKEMTEATPKLIQAIDISFIWIPLACWLILGFIFYSWKKQNKELDSFRKADENYKPL